MLLHLHLDAVREISEILDDSGWKVGRKEDLATGCYTERQDNACLLRTDVMARIEMVVQLPILLLQTTFCQTLRGAACLFSGILVFDQARIKFGMIDIISVIAQVILLPLIALAGLLNPKWAGDLTAQLCDPQKEKMERNYSEDPNEIPIRHKIESDMDYDATTRNVVASALMSLVEVPVGLVDAVLKTASYTLSGGIFLDDRKRARIGSIAGGAFMTLPRLTKKESQKYFIDDTLQQVIEHRGLDCSFAVNRAKVNIFV